MVKYLINQTVSMPNFICSLITLINGILSDCSGTSSLNLNLNTENDSIILMPICIFYFWGKLSNLKAKI
jgi:hypothetical protein